jgi:hypothetical protein
MSARKERVTVTLDPEVIRAGNIAVEAGRAVSLSAWINAALSEQVFKEKKLKAMAEAVKAYESEFGAFTKEELEERRRLDRENSILVSNGRVVRGAHLLRKKRRRSS